MRVFCTLEMCHTHKHMRAMIIKLYVFDCFHFYCRLIFGDGTGEGHMYISDHLVPEAMGIPGCDWSELCDLVQQVGQLVYNKPLITLHQVTTCSLSMFISKMKSA